MNFIIDGKLPKQNFEEMTEIYKSNGDIIFVKEGRFFLNNIEINSSSIPPLALRIANGGGGQTGLFRELSLAYFKEKNPKYNDKDVTIAWRGTNTTYSLESLEKCIVDIAVVYELEKEIDALYGTSTKEKYTDYIEHVWMDHFNYIGPNNNPANVINGVDDFDTAIDKIMKSNNSYWLTRNDKSAINEKEKYIILNRVNFHRNKLGLPNTTIEQLIDDGKEAVNAWNNLLVADEHLKSLKEDHKDIDLYQKNLIVLNEKYNKATEMIGNKYKKGFYREHKLLPLQATEKAAELGYYTMSDNGIFYTVDKNKRSKLKIVLDGMDDKYQPYFLNPADALLSRCTVCTCNTMILDFYKWFVGSTAQEICKTYKGFNKDNINPLFTNASIEYSINRKKIMSDYKSLQKKMVS